MVLNTFRNSPWSFRNSSAKLTEIPFKEAKGPLKVCILYYYTTNKLILFGCVWIPCIWEQIIVINWYQVVNLGVPYFQTNPTWGNGCFLGKIHMGLIPESYGGKTIQYGFKTRFSDESGILDLWPNPKGWHHGFGQCIPDTLNLVIIMSDIILASKAGYDPFIKTKLGANLKTQQNHPKEKDEQWATCLTYKKSPKYVVFLCQCVPFHAGF